MVKPGERLGNYEVSASADGSANVLGSGAGGITYRGKHIHLGTEVAIKVLIRRKNLLQKDRDAFLSEARSAASLSHPQIARILDFGESRDQHPYYVMELCEGGSLEDLGRKTGPPDSSTCIQWLLESAGALAHAHHKGILHRDIKPSNLLVAIENGTASIKLIDFGLADHVDQDGVAENVIGTPLFAAPEQLQGQAVPASDVFSLGGTFLWLLTGRHLSQGDVKAVISDRLSVDSYAHLFSDVPPAWMNILGKMLELDPVHRLRDGGEVLAQVHAIFPDHSPHPVVWEDSANFQGPASAAPVPSQWTDHPSVAWNELWTETSKPVPTEHGTQLQAKRNDASGLYEVSRFLHLPEEIVPILSEQADLVARNAANLGLGQVLLERGNGWWSVAWPDLGTDDALSWVRQGQAASTPEVLTALDPLATGLDGISSRGFEHLEIHPSMLMVRGGSGSGQPLGFSISVPLPVLAVSEHKADSSGTMRVAMGVNLYSRFAACVYQLLSGRTVPPAAFVNARAYQAIPRLTEKSNRFLASAISGSLAGGTCQDIVRGLAYEERVPGASYTGSLSAGASVGARLGSLSHRSNPNISIPTATSPAVSQRTIPVAPPAPPVSSAASTPPPLTPVVASTVVSTPPPPPVSPPASPASSSPPAISTAPATLVSTAVASPISAPVTVAPPAKKSSPLKVLVPAGIVGLALFGTAAWIVVPKYLKKDKPTPESNTPSAPPVVEHTAPETEPKTAKDPGEPVKPKTPDTPPTKTLSSTVKVPGDAATLTLAIEQCKDGGTIELAGGTHSEPVVLTKSLTITGTDGASLEDRGLETSLVTIRGPIQVTITGVVIKNSQKQARGKAESAPPLVLAADGPTIRFESCDFEGSSGAGISLVDKAKANFSYCHIRSNRGFGVNASAGSKGEFTRTEIQENGLGGILAVGVGTTVTTTNGSTISKNSKNGIEIGNGAALVCSNVKITGNRQVGLVVEGSGSQARVDSATAISANLSGVAVLTAGKFDLTGGTIESNREHGLYAKDGAKVQIDSSTFTSNGRTGVFLDSGESTSVTLTKTTFTSHSSFGVAFSEGLGKVSDCVFENNQAAILFTNKAHGSASGNKVTPGPLEESIIREADAGEVTLENNTAGADP